jgi:hypothetical protein
VTVPSATRTRPGGYEGAQTEYVRVPFADTGPLKIPDDMDEEDVLFLSDTLPTGRQGRRNGQHPAGRNGWHAGCSIPMSEKSMANFGNSFAGSRPAERA